MSEPVTRDPSMDTVADDMGPGGICGDCGHFACRHVGEECLFHTLDPDKYKPCGCKGMLWNKVRYVMDPNCGPLRAATL